METIKQLQDEATKWESWLKTNPDSELCLEMLADIYIWIANSKEQKQFIILKSKEDAKKQKSV